MKRKVMAAALSALMLTSAVSCGSSSEKSTDIKDVASAAKKYIEDDYSGIIASDAKYSLTDTESMTIRKKIKDKANYASDWIIIVDGGEYELFYAEGWDKKAKGYKDAENEDGLTLKELYTENVGEFKEAPDLPSVGSYLEKSKRESANSDASSLYKAVSSAMSDLDYDDVDVYNIGYIVFENGKITEFNYTDPTKADSVSAKVEESVKNYYDDVDSIGCAIVFCSSGSVSEVYISDSMNDTVSGVYPSTYDDSIYEDTMSYVFDDNKDWYEVEVRSEKDINDDTARNLYYTLSSAAGDAVYYHYDDLEAEKAVDVKAVYVEAGKITDVIYSGEADKKELMGYIQEYYDEEADYYLDYYPEINEVNGFALFDYNYIEELYVYNADGNIVGSYPELDSEDDLEGLTLDKLIKDKAEEYELEVPKAAEDDKKAEDEKKNDDKAEEAATTEAAEATTATATAKAN